MAKKKGKTPKKDNSVKFFSVIFCFISILLVYGLFSLEVLPAKYITLVIGIIIFINILFYFLLRHTKKNIIIKIIMFLLSIGFIYGIYSLFNTKEILDDMNIDYKTHNYVVIVNKDSKYQHLEDLENKKIGYLENDDINERLKIKCKKEKYNDVNILVNDLFDKKLDGIILENSYVEMFSDEDSPIKKFNSKIRIIHKFSMDIEVEDISKDVNTTSNTFALYLSGIDTYGSISSVSRSDANMVAVVNPETKQILLISIPRDYYVTLYGKNAKDKLTHSGIYGIETTVKTVENLLDLEINYYYKINFSSLIKIVDAIGGVDVYSEYTFTSKDRYNYKKGYNHVNGKQALSFARERKAFSGGDRVRNKNQQALVEAMFRKCTSSSIITRYNSLLKSVKGSFVTNMPSERLTSLIKMQIEDNSKWSITSISLNGVNAREYTYSYSGGTLYVMKPTQSTIDNAKALIKKVYDGEVLKSSYSDNIGKVNTVTTSPKKPNNNNNKVDIEYTVTFHNEDNITTKKVKEKTLVLKPNDPVREGYTFIGWYYNNSLFDFNTPITSNITLFAQFEKKKRKTYLLNQKNQRNQRNQRNQKYRGYQQMIIKK